MGDTRQSKSTGAARCTGAEAWGRLLVGLGDHVRKQPAADAALGAFRWDPTRDMQRVEILMRFDSTRRARVVKQTNGTFLVVRHEIPALLEDP